MRESNPKTNLWRRHFSILGFKVTLAGSCFLVFWKCLYWTSWDVDYCNDERDRKKLNGKRLENFEMELLVKIRLLKPGFLESLHFLSVLMCNVVPAGAKLMQGIMLILASLHYPVLWQRRKSKEEQLLMVKSCPNVDILFLC